GVLLREVLLEGAIRVVPRPEVVELAPDLLGPHPGGVREEGEVRSGLRGLAAAVAWRRIVRGHGDDLLKSRHCDPTGGGCDASGDCIQYSIQYSWCRSGCKRELR